MAEWREPMRAGRLRRLVGGQPISVRARAANGMGIVVMEDATSPIVGHVTVVKVANISQVKATNHIGTDGFNLN